MDPKEKAIKLIEYYEPFVDYNDCDCFTQRENMKKNAIICAMISVNEIINSNPHSNLLNTGVYSTMKFWQDVKYELENM
jgi:hypothetical protein